MGLVFNTKGLAYVIVTWKRKRISTLTFHDFCISTSILKPEDDNLCDSQLLTEWDSPWLIWPNSQILLKIGTFHNRGTYLLHKISKELVDIEM